MKKKDAQGTSQKQMGKEELAHFVDLLENGDNFEKERAIDALISFPGKDVVEGIVPLLQEVNTGARMAVLDILKKIGSSHIDGIIRMLYDENEDIRVYGCEVLSFLKDRRAIPSLIDKLRNDEENTRNAACVALGDFDDEEAVMALLVALKDVEWIAFSAIYSLGRTKSIKAVPELLEFFKNSEEELSVAACEVLMEYGDDAVLDELFEILKGWSREKRNAYLRVILEKGNEDIFQKLKEKIGDELYEHLLNSIRYEKQCSLEIMHMLAYFRHDETCEAILDVLADMSPENDNYGPILELFVSLSDVWIPSVENYMKRDEKYCLPIMQACKSVGVKLKEELLLNIFLSSSVDVKREIITGIPAILDGSGALLVGKAIQDTDGHIKGHAVDAIGLLSLQDLKDEIVNIAKKDFFDVRTKAMNVLVRLDRDQAIKLMESFVYDGTSEDKKVCIAAVNRIDSEKNFTFIEKLSSDDDETVRRSAIGSIGYFLDSEAHVNLLKKILMDDDIPHEVLKIIKDKKLNMFRDRLVEIFMDIGKGLWTRYYALMALAVFEDGSLFDIFVSGLKDDNNLIIIGCIRALSDLNNKKAIHYIRPFADNSNEDVQSTAASVLEKLESV
jgi:HEAT repeat protein